MITVTPFAVSQIQLSSTKIKGAELPLRIAIKTKTDGSFHYLMGFDNKTQATDKKIRANGVTIILDEASQILSNGMTLDYVEIERKKEFIFLNPNDPHYKSPQR